MGHSKRSAHVILWNTSIGQSLWTVSALTFYPKRVLTAIGSFKTSGSVSKVIKSKGVTKESIDPGSSKA